MKSTQGPSRTRRQFLNSLGWGAFGLSLSGCLGRKTEGKPNLLLLTADDMNYDSPGSYGCRIPDITPNIDRLAAEGMKFEQAHVNISVCQPCRQSLLTGRYAVRHGGEGFHPIRDDVSTLVEELKKSGYLNGILGKEKHYKPDAKFAWDFVAGEKDLASGLGIGRSPERYHDSALEFFKTARKSGKPFFLSANAHDPHRPFAGSLEEQKDWGRDLPRADRRIRPDEVTIPGFLPDLPEIRTEIAQYFTSVHRCDRVVGSVLDALDETGFTESTLVLFLSDNGMSFPFAKANCYLNSTRTPWIVRWPGRVGPAMVNRDDLISAIDVMPTFLEAAGCPPTMGMDGRSFLDLLLGKGRWDREEIFTEFHETSARRRFPMRAVMTRRFGYIINFWADGKTAMTMDSTGGMTFRAMQDAARSDSEIARRVELFSRRVREEFYDFSADPDGLHNLIGDPRYAGEIRRLRSKLEDHLARIDDPALEALRRKDDPAAIAAFMEAQRARSKALSSRSNPKI